ncbi:putative inactive histone-lysine N-methyltransferase SUVR1 [Hordeum vulgare]|nr:putative inactive histone-lysine N-methyltransferase SUVR1 [Hordeum vulgare]
MHGAIDHFGRMGYAEADIRNTVRQLIEVYGEDASSFLKEDDYRVVQDALFEKQEQEEEPKQKEAAISEAPVASGMHNEMPPGAELSVEGADPMLIDPRASEATMSRPAARGTSSARRPCYGWISESESDSDYEEYLASRRQEMHASIPGSG